MTKRYSWEKPTHNWRKTVFLSMLFSSVAAPALYRFGTVQESKEKVIAVDSTAGEMRIMTDKNDYRNEDTWLSRKENGASAGLQARIKPGNSYHIKSYGGEWLRFFGLRPNITALEQTAAATAPVIAAAEASAPAAATVVALAELTPVQKQAQLELTVLDFVSCKCIQPIDSIRALFGRGVDPQGVYKALSGKSFLQTAAADNDIDMLQVLKEKGVPFYQQHIEETDTTPLSLAVENGHDRTVSFLLQNGANASDPAAMRVLHKYFNAENDNFGLRGEIATMLTGAQALQRNARQVRKDSVSGPGL